MILRPATLFDLAGVRQLLTAAKLPVADIAEHFGGFVVGEEQGAMLATGGLEVHGRLGLLRSVAVKAAERRHGHGRAVVADLLEEAARRDLTDVWLLTTTAREFFAALNFEAVDRDQAPKAIRGTRQFTTLCPNGATLMRRRVAPGTN